MAKEWQTSTGTTLLRCAWASYVTAQGTLLLRKWSDTGFTPLGLTPVLSHFLILALGFEFQVGCLENIWLTSGWFSGLIPQWWHKGTSLSGLVDKDEWLLKKW
jgi:hypothetical protein